MNKGGVYAILAYILWGFFPVYFKLLDTVPALQILGHRIVWSFLLLLIILSVRKEWQELARSITWKRMALYAGAGALLAINWGTYVWAVNADYVVESSLGYFINPLVSVLLGVVFLREKLRSLQWVPVALAVLGVGYLTIQYGKPPWIALVLAFSFGFYGLIKKIAPLGSLQGLTIETAAIFVPSLAYLLWTENMGVGRFGHSSTTLNLFMVLTGIITISPLLLFAEGARRIPLVVIGLLQFIAPTIQFLTAIILFGEPFSITQGVGFGIIWLALILFSLESYSSQRKTSLLSAAAK